MATLTIGKILDEGSKYQSVIFKGKWESLEVFSADKDGDVEITMTDGKFVFTAYLNQEDTKLLSDHLVKQIKPIKV